MFPPRLLLYCTGSGGTEQAHVATKKNPVKKTRVYCVRVPKTLIALSRNVKHLSKYFNILAANNIWPKHIKLQQTEILGRRNGAEY